MHPSRQPAKAPTAFAGKVYRVVEKIPRGKVATYGAVAAEIGSGIARAVGQAMRKNPFAPVVPCHRVVCADGSLGGFFGEQTHAALEKKRRLLEREGVEFDAAGRVEERFILRRL